MIDSKAHIAADDRRFIAELLSQLLSECALLEMKVRLCLWSSRDPVATSLGARLRNRSRQLRALAADAAKRVRALGFTPSVGLGELFARAVVVKQAPPSKSTRELLAELAEDHLSLAAMLRFARPALSDVEDGASLTLLDRALLELEEASSMLRETSLRQDRERLLLDEALDHGFAGYPVQPPRQG